MKSPSPKSADSNSTIFERKNQLEMVNKMHFVSKGTHSNYKKLYQLDVKNYFLVPCI